MTAWAHLPNAAHIDRILADVKRRPDAWVAVRDAAWVAAWVAARGAALYAARDAAWSAARDAAWDAARDAAWDAALFAAQDAAQGAALYAAQDATLALIAWDDAGLMLDTPVPALRLYAANGSHAAVLMLPAATALGEAA